MSLRDYGIERNALVGELDKTTPRASGQEARSCHSQYRRENRWARHKFYSFGLTPMFYTNPGTFWYVIKPSKTLDSPLASSDENPVPITECAKLFKDSFAAVLTIVTLITCLYLFSAHKIYKWPSTMPHQNGSLTS